MRKIAYVLWMVMLALLTSEPVSAQYKRTIHVAIAGTLQDYISDDEKTLIEELVLTGEINGTDFSFLRNMTGGDRCDWTGNLRYLDLSGVSVVAGGHSYYSSEDIDEQPRKLGRNDIMPDRVFCNCKKLYSIILPNNLEIIDRQAFSGCSDLLHISIPDNLISMERSAFDGTAWLNSQPDGLVYLGDFLYSYKGEIPKNTNIEIKYGILHIGNRAFQGFTDLTSVTIPNSVISIGEIAFSGCNGLTSITLPNSVESIGSMAFYNCTGLLSINIPNSVTSIGYGAFSGCNGLTSITLPNSITSIGSAFSNCTGLTTINIPNSVTTLEESAFRGCTGLTSITIPNSVTSIEGYAFSGCTSLTSVNIPNSVTSIGGWAFYGCTGLTSVTIPSSVTSIGKGVFDNCKLAALIWNPDYALPSDAFVDAFDGTNSLLYVKNDNYAPSSVKNIVVNGIAKSIELSDDGGKFYCPQEFKANKISYTHNYSMETGGRGKGWETIVLPFDVQVVMNNRNGAIIPFASYDSKSEKKPFWLYQYNGDKFQRAKSIQANAPYLISMPNQSSYNSEYNLSGYVTFEAEDVNIPVTQEGVGSFVSAFSQVEKSNSVKVLNVVNKYVNETGGYDAGSRFISNLRDVRPFECYFKGSASTRSVQEMIGE